MNINKHCKNIYSDGYTIIENFFSKKQLDKVKSSLLDMLNYIEFSKEKNLQEKYYEIKKNYPKLKKNFYELAPQKIDMVKIIHSEKMINLVKNFLALQLFYLEDQQYIYTMIAMINY